MSVHEFLQLFITGLRNSTWYEILAVIAGIVSVIYSRKENILVYPIGLINTIIFVYISFRYHLPGEASVNLYYTIMSLYGWYQWMKKDTDNRPVVKVSFSNGKMWRNQLFFFAVFFAAIYLSLVYLKDQFFPGAIPWADALASAAAFTGMWLMTQKKVESWYWWIITNIASIPLYFVKGLIVTSVYYFILLIIAVFGLSEWKKRAHHPHA